LAAEDFLTVLGGIKVTGLGLGGVEGILEDQIRGAGGLLLMADQKILEIGEVQVVREGIMEAETTPVSQDLLAVEINFVC